MPAPERPNELSAMHLARALLRRRRTLVAFGLIGGICGASVALLKARTYTVNSSFMPQESKASSGLSALAAEAGLSLPQGSATESPAFYADLLASRTLLASVVPGPFTWHSDGQLRHGTLTEALGVKASTPAIATERTITELLRHLSVTPTQKTGLVRLTVTLRDPQLARDVAQTLISAVDRFNVETRRSQATGERAFVEARANEAAAELRQAEDKVQAFLQQNRDYRGSPSLTFDYERLSRVVATRQATYSALVQAFEQAKINQVRDTPVITVIERPTLPAEPDPRGLLRRTVLGIVLLGGAAFAVVLLALFVTPQPVEDPSLVAEDVRREWSRVLSTGKAKREISAGRADRTG